MVIATSATSHGSSKWLKRLSSVKCTRRRITCATTCFVAVCLLLQVSLVARSGSGDSSQLLGNSASSHSAAVNKRTPSSLSSSKDALKLSQAEQHRTPLDHHPKQTVPDDQDAVEEERCALNFWGLPRAFQSLVLPSLQKNVLPYAANCDVFVHYYNQTQEAAGRSGHGGQVKASEIHLLEAAVLDQYDKLEPSQQLHRPAIKFRVEPEADFWNRHGDLIEKIRTTKDDKGRYLYFPWKAKTYHHPVTTDNIIKMWHSIQSVFELMDDYAAANNIRYTRVAMLRSDVVYVTPLDVYHTDTGVDESKTAVIPGFGRYPVSDRILYGPYEAAKLWSTTRFSRLESHVQYMLENDPGWGLHSERFVKYQLLPAVRQAGFDVVEHPSLCFLRARADESVWISDCDREALSTVIDGLYGGNKKKRQEAQKARIEQVLGRQCGAISVLRKPLVHSLDCSSTASHNT